MKITFNNILITLFVLFTCAFGYAAPGDPPPPTAPPPPGLPVDGGIVFLLLASVAYGLYKLYHFNINKKNPV